MSRKFITAFAALALGATAVLAQEEERNPHVEARNHHMHLNAYSLGVLGGMAKGEIEYDAELATAAASRIHDLAMLDQTGYWPEGTSSEDLDYSRALPALFENLDDYNAKTEDLAQAAMEMQTAAGESAEAIGGQMQALGGACGACHEDYRQPND